jgi:type II secretory pathway pseudopilin PulG
MKRQMFSMLEVICVVAVSATLMTMLTSSVKTSKDVAMQATCMSNIAQIRDVTELYRLDHGGLPYSNIWMTDFSFAEGYLKEGNLTVFKCPGSSDEEVTSYNQLTHNTSYYFIPNGKQLAKNISDGSNYGITEDQVDQLIASQNGVIYDKSKDHHNGKVNIAYLFRDDDSNAELDSLSGSILTQNNSESLLDLDGANIVNLPEVTSVAVVEEEAEAVADTTVDFTIEGDEITLDENATVIYTVLGAAISYGGSYDMAVTTQFQVTDSGGNTEETPVFGDYDDAVSGNVNTGSQQTYTPDEVYSAGTTIGTQATSWKKKRSRYSGDSSSHWTEYMEIDDTNSANTMALIDGDDVPNISGYLDQGDIVSFLDGYIDENGKVTLDENQVILLFELGTTNLDSASADFQDLVILVTFVPAE